jgi:hypothetical protein
MASWGGWPAFDAIGNAVVISVEVLIVRDTITIGVNRTTWPVSAFNVIIDTVAIPIAVTLSPVICGCVCIGRAGVYWGRIDEAVVFSLGVVSPNIGHIAREGLWLW